MSPPPSSVENLPRIVAPSLDDESIAANSHSTEKGVAIVQYVGAMIVVFYCDGDGAFHLLLCAFMVSWGGGEGSIKLGKTEHSNGDDSRNL